MTVLELCFSQLKFQIYCVDFDSLELPWIESVKTKEIAKVRFQKIKLLQILRSKFLKERKASFLINNSAKSADSQGSVTAYPAV